MTPNRLNVITSTAPTITSPSTLGVTPRHQPGPVYMVVRIDNNFSGHVGVLSCRTAASGIDETSPNALLIVSQPGHAVVSWCNFATTADVATGGVFCLVRCR